MQHKLILFWAWVSVILPTLIGLLFIFNPIQAIPEGTTLVDLARIIGIKNVVYSGLLLYAILSKSRLLLVAVLLGRGIGDILDGATGLAAGFMVMPYYMALLTGIITTIAALFLAKEKPQNNS